MGLIVDLIIILIFAACIYLGYKRGLAKCLLKLLTSVLAIIIAIILYKPFVNFVVESTTIDNNIQLSIEKLINENSDDNDEKLIKDDSGMPKAIVDYVNDGVNEKANEEKQEAAHEISVKVADLIVCVAGIIIIYIIAKIIIKNSYSIYWYFFKITGY